MMKKEGQISDERIMELYRIDKQKGNEAAIQKYENYIYEIINRLNNHSMFLREMEDLHQSGCIGIMEALKGYDVNKGKFYNYCYNYVKKRVVEQIRNFLGESSEYYEKLHRDILKTRDDIIKEGGTASVEEIMKRAGKSRKLVVRELQLDYTKVSYETLGEGWICY